MTKKIDRLRTEKRSKNEIWKERFGLLKTAFCGFDGDIRRRIQRRVLYRLFKPAFKVASKRCAIKKTASIHPEIIHSGEEKGLVSVVLPVYNQADFLEASIQSVLTQRYKKFELIIVNDGSTDGVEQVLDKYIQHSNVIILTQENQKLPAALQTGFYHAKGEFYTWTSADNLMHENQLEEQVTFLKRNDYAQMVFCNYELIDDNGKPGVLFAGSNTNIVDTDQDIYSLNYTYNFINACFLYRSYAAKIIGPYESDMYGAEDYDYWMRFNDDFVISHIGKEKPFYRYRVHRNTIFGREGKDAIDDAIKRAQDRDIERKKFFEYPMVFFVPCSVASTGLTKDFSKWSQGDSVREYERLDDVLGLLKTAQRGKKRVVMMDLKKGLREDEVHCLESLRGDNLLCILGLVTGGTDCFQRKFFSFCDWLIFEEDEGLSNLTKMEKQIAFHMPTWREMTVLFRIMANHCLFLKKGNKKSAPWERVPEHRYYGVHQDNPKGIMNEFSAH